jgi:thioredoxin 1
MKTNYWIAACAVSLCTALSPLSAEESSTRNEDLKVFLSEMLSEDFLQLTAQQAIDTLKKEINPDDLVLQFRKALNEEETFAKFSNPYQSTFTDMEIATLRAIFETPVFKKLSKEGSEALISTFTAAQTVFMDLAQNYQASSPYTAEKSVVSYNVIEVTQDNFKEVVEQSYQPVIIDVYADWCSPCRRIAPLIGESSSRYPNIRFVKINIDEQADLASHYGVTRLPTILFLLPGNPKPVMTATGLLSQEALNAKIAKFEEMDQNRAPTN